MTRPRADERAALAGHIPESVENELLKGVHQRYPQWEVTREDGRLVARHRTEESNARLERSGIHTTVTATTVEELEPRLFVQRALRGDGAQP